MSKVSIDQMVKMLHTLTQDNIYKVIDFESWDDVVTVLASETGHYNAPFAPHELDVIPMRYPVLRQARDPKSMFIQELMDRPGLACIVSDEIIKGREGLHIAALVDDWMKSQEWLKHMKPKELLIHQLDDEYVFVSPLSCFIH